VWGVFKPENRFLRMPISPGCWKHWLIPPLIVDSGIDEGVPEILISDSQVCLCLVFRIRSKFNQPLCMITSDRSPFVSRFYLLKLYVGHNAVWNQFFEPAQVDFCLSRSTSSSLRLATCSCNSHNTQSEGLSGFFNGLFKIPEIDIEYILQWNLTPSAKSSTLAESDRWSRKSAKIRSFSKFVLVHLNYKNCHFSQPTKIMLNIHSANCGTFNA
jgi:hypothetical protein